MTAEANDTLLVERRSGFWFGCLSRPARRNALSEDSLGGIEALCERVSADAGARALVISGASGHFCAGADFSTLSEIMACDPSQERDPLVLLNRRFGVVLERIASVPVPTIAVVRGACAGGGCGIAAACDRVISEDSAIFSLPEATLGVVPAQIAPFVVGRTGAVRGRWLMVSGARLHAPAARDCGLVDAVVSSASLRELTMETLGVLGLAEPQAIRATKRIVALTRTSPLPAVLDFGALEFAAALRSGRSLEGIQARAERRAPAWRIPAPELPDFL